MNIRNLDILVRNNMNKKTQTSMIKENVEQ